MRVCVWQKIYHYRLAWRRHEWPKNLVVYLVFVVHTIIIFFFFIQSNLLLCVALRCFSLCNVYFNFHCARLFICVRACVPIYYLRLREFVFVRVVLRSFAPCLIVFFLSFSVFSFKMNLAVFSNFYLLLVNFPFPYVTKKMKTNLVFSSEWRGGDVGLWNRLVSADTKMMSTYAKHEK